MSADQPDATLEEGRQDVLYVQCQQHHKWHTRNSEQPCPTCGGPIINAYFVLSQMPTAAELIGGEA